MIWETLSGKSIQTQTTENIRENFKRYSNVCRRYIIWLTAISEERTEKTGGGNEIIKNFPEFKETIPEIERANPLSSDINKRDSDTSW